MNRKTILTIFFSAFLGGCLGGGMYVKLDSTHELNRYVDKKVELRGHISNVMWQHMFAHIEDYDHSFYFDVGDFQIVVYAAEPIDCAGELTVRGRVVELRGPSKQPDSKVDDSYVEYHLVADDWECR